MPRALLNGTVIADATQTVVVEGNHYFPPESLDGEHLRDSPTKTLCPWKGVARYHDVVVDGALHPDVAWSYPRPSPLARRIRGQVAFDRRVTVEPTDHDAPSTRIVDRLWRREGRR